jgi:hypothetical protein
MALPAAGVITSSDGCRTRLRNLVRVTTVRERISAVLDGAVGYESGLDALTIAPSTEVDPVLTAILHDACAALWRGGWQPVELHRVVARRGHPMHALCRANSPCSTCELVVFGCGQAARRYSLIKPCRTRRLRTARSSGITTPGS